MAQIRIHFHHTLNDFIAPAFHGKIITHAFERKASVKDMIESFNVPHTEVERILVNGRAVSFDYRVQDGDVIEVFPVMEDSPFPLLLRPQAAYPPAFIADTNLGRLARYLRLLGLDCLYRNDFEDPAVARIASEQGRTVLTRDRSLLHRKIITHGYFVRADIPKAQVKEVLKRFNMYSLIKPFRRCVSCNGQLIEITKQEIAHRLEPLTDKFYDKFLTCPDCKQIYWQGSHYSRIRQLIDELSHPDPA